jgi:uncharacterized OsmC-like protein
MATADKSVGVPNPQTKETNSVQKLNCRTVATGGLGYRHYIRGLPPPGFEATDTSPLIDAAVPSPSEALLAALGACLSTSIHANAVARAIPIRYLEIKIDGAIGFAPLASTAKLTPQPLGFETITVSVHIEADVSREVLEALVEHTILWSPVANTLHNPVHLDVNLEETNSSERST